jgi:hypothetical protein
MHAPFDDDDVETSYATAWQPDDGYESRILIGRSREGFHFAIEVARAPYYEPSPAPWSIAAFATQAEAEEAAYAELHQALRPYDEEACRREEAALRRFEEEPAGLA